MAIDKKDISPTEPEKEEIQLADIYENICVVKTTHKIKSFDFGPFHKNSIQVYWYSIYKNGLGIIHSYW